MIVIKTLANLRCLKRSKALPDSYVALIEENFMCLMDTLRHRETETEEEFSLDEHGYIVVLQRCDDLRDLSTVGLHRDEGGLLGGLDWIDALPLGDRSVYIMNINYSDAYTMTFFSEVGIHDHEIEAWLDKECSLHAISMSRRLRNAN